MRFSLRSILTSLCLLFFGVSLAFSQTYEVTANQSALTPEEGTADAHCLVQTSGGTLVFFNSEEGGIYTWDGSSLGVHTSPSDLNSNISEESGTIDRCDAVAIDGDDNLYFSFRSSSNNVNHIYKTDAGDASSFTVKEINGINGLTVGESTLYLAGVSGFGATRNGIFSIGTDLSGDTSAVAANSDVNLADATIDLSSSGVLYGWSTGSGSFEEVIVSVDPSASSPSFSAFVDPYADGTLSKSDDLISDLEIVTHQGTEFITVYNASFGASDGEEWGTIQLSDQSVSLLFTQTDLAENIEEVEGYTGGFTEAMYANDAGEVFVASRDAFGASDYLASVTGAPPLPVEIGAFAAVRNGTSVELTWQTLSETNNAGFAVQHQAPGSSEWLELGFVESKATGGTTTQSRSYRFETGSLDGGTHTFRLKQVDADGTQSFSEQQTVTVTAAAGLSLRGPNPLRQGEVATATVNVGTSQPVTIALYNVLGQRVKTIASEQASPGQPVRARLSTDDLPSGLYFLRATGPSLNVTRRVVVAR